MAKYTAGPSRLSLGGQPIQPDQSFEHDFSVDGPEGEHGPGREAALLAAGAIVKVEDAAMAPAETLAAIDNDSTASAGSRRSRKQE
jgi:hypothetical protein